MKNKMFFFGVMAIFLFFNSKIYAKMNPYDRYMEFYFPSKPVNFEYTFHSKTYDSNAILVDDIFKKDGKIIREYGETLGENLEIIEHEVSVDIHSLPCGSFLAEYLTNRYLSGESNHEMLSYNEYTISWMYDFFGKGDGISVTIQHGKYTFPTNYYRVYDDNRNFLYSLEADQPRKEVFVKSHIYGTKFHETKNSFETLCIGPLYMYRDEYLPFVNNADVTVENVTSHYAGISVGIHAVYYFENVPCFKFYLTGIYNYGWGRAENDETTYKTRFYKFQGDAGVSFEPYDGVRILCYWSGEGTEFYNDESINRQDKSYSYNASLSVSI